MLAVYITSTDCHELIYNLPSHIYDSLVCAVAIIKSAMQYTAGLTNIQQRNTSGSP